MRFGRLTVIGRAKSNSHGNPRRECRCDCGNIKSIDASSLRKGETQSCGCLRRKLLKERRAKDITGQRFGQLTALYPTGESHNSNAIWKCRCDCGREIEISIKNLSRTPSCSECRQHGNSRHGDAKRGNETSLYRCWLGIKQRCLNPKCKSFKYYGGRGVTVAPEWAEDFVAFRDHVTQTLGPKPSPQHTIDRIENDEGYFPGNLHWATKPEQAHNSRGSIVNKVFDAIVRECLNKPTKRRR